MTGRDIQVVVVEDSPTVRAYLEGLFNGTPGMRVIGTAADGEQAIAVVRETRPDVVTMDVTMPRMDGLEATRRIMQDTPVPIVMLSAIVEAQVSASFRALEAGALVFLRRPVGLGHPAYQREAAEIVRTVRLMSEVKVVRRHRSPGLAPPAPPQIPPKLLGHIPRCVPLRAVAIGASTGGPTAVAAVLSALPPAGTAPVLIVQHMAAGFLEGFCKWLTDVTGRRVVVGADGDALLPDHVYIAPDRTHMGVDVRARIVLSEAPFENGLRPAVSYLFRSAFAAYGDSLAAVLLSGMGKDGAKELLDLRNAGCLTFAQDAATAVVFGMPGEAVRLDAARYVLPPAGIGAALGTQMRPSGVVHP